jgi:hypothetical protein
MKTYALAIPLGISIALMAGGITYCILGGTSYFEKKYMSTPAVKEAVEYKIVADELETCANYMSGKVVADGTNFIIFEKPDNTELKETLKHSLDETVLPSDQKNYAKEIVGLYTRLENLDYTSSGIMDLTQKEDYAQEYSNIKTSIDSLSDELMSKAVSKDPNINTDYEKYKSIDYNGAWGIAPTIFGAVGVIIFSIYLPELISDNRRSSSSSRRTKTQI